MPDTTVSDDTLRETPMKTLKFLRAIGTDIHIFSAMAGRGYNEAAHNQGWALLHETSGYRPAAPLPQLNDTAHKAIAEIDAMDEDLFRITRATLKKWPALFEEVLAGISASEGSEALVGTTELVTRLDQVEARNTRETKEAMKQLGERGLSAAERERIKQLLKDAKGVATLPNAPAAPAAQAGETLSWPCATGTKSGPRSPELPSSGETD